MTGRGGKKTIAEPFLTAYASSSRQAAEQALKSLDSSTSWAVTFTLGILAFAINATVVSPNVTSAGRLLVLAIVSMGFPMLVHFGIRAAKSYINIVRFAKLEREALKCCLQIEDGSAENLIKSLQLYHLAWRSPINRGRIVFKVLFEFGFFYLIAFLIVLAYFIVRDIPDLWQSWLVFVLLTVIAILLEVLNFSHSPYIKETVPDGDSTTLS